MLIETFGHMRQDIKGWLRMHDPPCIWVLTGRGICVYFMFSSLFAYSHLWTFLTLTFKCIGCKTQYVNFSKKREIKFQFCNLTFPSLEQETLSGGCTVSSMPINVCFFLFFFFFSFLSFSFFADYSNIPGEKVPFANDSSRWAMKWVLLF